MPKLTNQALTLFAACAAVMSQAQTYQPPPHFNHVVIIFQENRTPDNIFGSQPSVTTQCGQEDPFEGGVDIANGGPNIASRNNGGPYITCTQPLPNMQGGGGNHSHLDWTNEFDSGAMDGACIGYYNGKGNPICPPYTYVDRSVVQPYFDIATNYGFANYMFQTNQGPSFPAHEFIFGGTSAPVWPTNSYYQYFVAENGGGSTGCPVGPVSARWIDPSGKELADPNKSECYDRNTLVTYQDSSGVVHDKTVNLVNGGWKYYAQTPGILWDAPEADPQTCYFATSGSGGCTSSEFTSHVSFPKKGSSLKSAPIFTDIQNCQLAAITWVTPDEAWSDHPGSGDQSLGPSWVADIVDAIGNSGVNSGGKCDYWKADPTAVFITWDDWGGFYDHVPPPVTYLGTFQNGQWDCPAPNGWGCGYVYGFRVPMLVVSEYTPPKTISGAISGAPTYPPPTQWTHDFGSILNFIETNFQLPPIAPTGYTYADSNTLDTVYQGQTVVPLWEFFVGSPRTFTTINSPFDANYFMNYYTTEQNGGYPVPTGPDADDD